MHKDRHIMSGQKHRHTEDVVDMRVGEKDGGEAAPVKDGRMPFPIRRGRVAGVDDDGFVSAEHPIRVLRERPDRVDDDAYLRPYFLLNLSTRPSDWIIRSEPM